MDRNERAHLIQRYRKCKSSIQALKVARPKEMSLEAAKVYLKILDDVERDIDLIDKALYVLGRDPEIKVLSDFHEAFDNIKNCIDTKFDGLTQEGIK